MELNTTSNYFILGENKSHFFRDFPALLAVDYPTSTCRIVAMDDLFNTPSYNALTDTVFILQTDQTAAAFRKMARNHLHLIVQHPCIIILPDALYKTERTIWSALGFSDVLPEEKTTPFTLTKSIEYILEKNRIVSNKESQDKIYEQAFHNSAMPSMIYDIENLKIIEVNEAAIQQYGYSREEFLHLSPLELHPENSRNKAVLIFENLAPHHEYRNTHEHARKDGSIFHADIQSNSIRYKNVRARSIVVIDITQNLEYQKALLQSEQRFKTLVQESGDLILIVNTKGVIQYSSTNHWTILGFQEKDLLNRNILEMVHEEDRADMQEFINSLSHSKRLYSKAFRTINGHGKLVWLEAIGSNAIDEPGVNGLVLNTRDISNRVESENKLRGISERFATIAQATSDAIYEYDFDEQFIQLTGVGYHVLLGFGYENDRMTYEQYKSMIHPKD